VGLVPLGNEATENHKDIFCHIQTLLAHSPNSGMFFWQEAATKHPGSTKEADTLQVR